MATLLLLDREAALANLDFDAGGLLVLIDHVAEYGGTNDKDGDDDGERVAGHGNDPGKGTGMRAPVCGTITTRDAPIGSMRGNGFSVLAAGMGGEAAGRGVTRGHDTELPDAGR